MSRVSVHAGTALRSGRLGRARRVATRPVARARTLAWTFLQDHRDDPTVELLEECDEPAVANALLLPYSNDPTEGNVHRIKLIERTMYGRASFELLRKKILHHEA